MDVLTLPWIFIATLRREAQVPVSVLFPLLAQSWKEYWALHFQGRDIHDNSVYMAAGCAITNHKNTIPYIGLPPSPPINKSILHLIFYILNFRTLPKNSVIFSALFTPGDSSTPPDTSTPKGWEVSGKIPRKRGGMYVLVRRWWMEKCEDTKIHVDIYRYIDAYLHR